MKEKKAQVLFLEVNSKSSRCSKCRVVFQVRQISTFSCTLSLRLRGGERVPFPGPYMLLCTN